MIINHDLFAGSDSDPKAIKNVQAEIRKFAKERMEIMLGMRKETAEVERLEIEFPFNALQVDILKKLASAATKGKSDQGDNYVPEVRRVREDAPVVPRHTSLNTIGSSKKAAPAPRQAPQPSKKPLQSRAATPVKRSRLDMDIDQICREEGIPRALLEENIKMLKKPTTELTDQELLERNRVAAERRGTQVASSNALPMPTQEQINNMAETHANKIASSKLAPSIDMSRLIDTVKKMPVK
jgi:hypothetical protein